MCEYHVIRHVIYLFSDDVGFLAPPLGLFGFFFLAIATRNHLYSIYWPLPLFTAAD